MQYPDFVFETLPDDPCACDLSVPYIEYYPNRHHSNSNNNTNTSSRYHATTSNSLSNTHFHHDNNTIQQQQHHQQQHGRNLGCFLNAEVSDYDNFQSSSPNTSTSTGYSYRCLLCHRQDLCEQGIQFHCNEPYHMNRVTQLHHDKALAQLLLDKWQRTGVIIRSGHTTTTSTTTSTVNQNTRNVIHNKNSFQYRLEQLKLPAWQYHVQSLLYRYMTTIDDTNTATTTSNNNNNGTVVLSFEYLEQAHMILKRYEYMERLSLLELAIWKAVCIVEMKPIICYDTIISSSLNNNNNNNDNNNINNNHPQEGQRKENNTNKNNNNNNNTNVTFPFLDYFSIMDWTKNGWKCNKSVMRKSNAIAIIIEHVIPFLGHYYDQQDDEENSSSSSSSGGGNNNNNNNNNSTNNTYNVYTTMAGRTARPRPWASSSFSGLNSSNTTTMNGTSPTSLNNSNNLGLSSLTLGGQSNQNNNTNSILSSGNNSTNSNSSNGTSFTRRWGSSRKSNLKQQVTVYNFQQHD